MVTVAFSKLVPILIVNASFVGFGANVMFSIFAKLFVFRVASYTGIPQASVKRTIVPSRSFRFGMVSPKSVNPAWDR